MKKHLSLLCVIGCFSQSSWAADINNLSVLGQPAFKDFSDDLGAALSYKPITPTAPLGVTGFDVGVEATSTKVRNLDLATNSSSTNLVVPKLHAYKGLPLGFDIGAFYSAVPTTNIKLYGGELRYAILESGVARSSCCRYPRRNDQIDRREPTGLEYQKPGPIHFQRLLTLPRMQGWALSG